MPGPRERSTFHRGEIAMQVRAGVRDSARRVGGIIGEAIPEVFAAFLGTLRVAAVGAEDAEGRLWATVLVGPRGFLRARGPENARDRLEIAALPLPGDALAEKLSLVPPLGAPAGIVAIDLPTRRRVRVNGMLGPAGGLAGTGFALDVREAYGNCPKYITARAVPEAPRAPVSRPARRGIVAGESLSEAQLALVRAADTLFVASLGPGGRADASHRGGAPGFVSAPAANRLVIPDYRGNRMFNTFGNLLVDSRIGIAFPDFEHASLLQVSGRARIADHPAATAPFPGAERVLEVGIESVLQVADALPRGWRLLGYSPFDPPPHAGDAPAARPRPPGAS